MPEGSEIVDVIISWGLKVIGAIVLFLIGRMVAKLIQKSLIRFFRRSNMDETLQRFLGNLIYYLLLTFVILMVLGVFGIQTASIIAVLGAAVFAVGLSLQGTLSNFAAGVMLLLMRPIKVGDFVDVGGTSGSVVDIGIFSSSLNTPDNVRIIVPNSKVYGEIIKNYAINDIRRVDMVMGIAYSDDIQTAVDTIERVIGSDSRVLKDPAATVAVSELADSSVNLVVRPWCKKEDYWDLFFDLHRKLKEELEAAGCNIPFPQRDVHLFKVGAES
jgi:small conductance mechanosensitive channel